MKKHYSLNSPQNPKVRLKPKNINNNDTLIVQHNNIINKFNNDKKNIINIQNTIDNIQKINNNLTKKNNSFNDDINILNYSINSEEDNILNNSIDEIDKNKSNKFYTLTKYINDMKLNNLNNIKHDIETSNNELDYYSKSLDLLEKYYNITNNKNKENDIYNIFESNNVKFNKNIDINNIKWEDNNIINLYNEFNNDDKISIIKAYNNIINNQPIVQYYDYNICPYCKNDKTINNNDGLIICTNCGNVEKILVESELPNYKNNNIDKPIYPYKRLNHFMECLNQFQAKENINIPENIYNKIINEFKSRRINDLSKITLSDTKYILKQLKLNKYYEHASFIYSKISGNPPPHLTYDQENKLKILFKRIDKSFNKFCPSDRRNFFNYNYLLHKLFQLINLNQYLDYFPLLKSKEKLFKQDEIWKLVCKDLNIIYIPN